MKSLFPLSRCKAVARSTTTQPAPQLFTYTTALYSSLTSPSCNSFRTSLASSLSSSSIASTPLSSSSLRSSLSSSFPPLYFQSVRHATKKAGGSVKNNSGSAGKRLGLKSSGGSLVHPGHILVRQRGLRTHPGRGVSMGRDETLVADRSGVVMFTYVLRPFRTKNKWRQYINVVDVAAGETKAEIEAETAALAAKYLEVLAMKRAGERVPTVRSVYLKGVAAEKREAERREREEMIAKVTASQEAGGGSGQVEGRQR